MGFGDLVFGSLVFTLGLGVRLPSLCKAQASPKRAFNNSCEDVITNIIIITKGLSQTGQTMILPRCSGMQNVCLINETV